MNDEQSKSMPPEIRQLLPDLIAWRRDFHSRPEIGYEEHRTAGLVAERLRAFGVDQVAEGIGRTGVVGVIRNGNGRTVGLRADMDALPITEVADRIHRSTTEGMMHACGHDGHTTILLGAAHYLAKTRRFSGTVVLIFQPAEEGKAGAKAMLDDGLLDRFPFDAVYGLHNVPGLPAGQIAVSPGPVMAAIDSFEVRIIGKGGHAALPHLNRDPVVAAASLIVSAQSIVSRNRNPNRAAVLSVTRVEAGEADNATPDTATLKGSVRFLEEGDGAQIQADLARIVRGTAETFGVQADLVYTVGRPQTANHVREAEVARRAAESLSSCVSVAARQVPLLASEDFSYFLQARPGAFAFLGAGENSPSLHSANYDFNDDLLGPGAAFLSRVAETELGRQVAPIAVTRSDLPKA
jgi:amidohydrolase